MKTMREKIIDKLCEHPYLSWHTDDNDKSICIEGTNLNLVFNLEDQCSIYGALYFEGIKDTSFTDIKKYIEDPDEVIQICEKVFNFFNEI